MYSRWANTNEYGNILTKIDLKKNIDKSGIQMMYKGNDLYIDDSEAHSLVIGDTGSGKTQTIVFPLIKTAINASESFIINDIKGEICKMIGDTLKENGYNTIIINLKNPNLGNNWNLLLLPYNLYKNGNKTEATKLLDNIGYYLFHDKKSIDPFWSNSATNYFVGLCLYLFENAKEEEINLNSVFSLSNSINEEKNLDKFIKILDKNSSIYYNLSGTITAPIETRGGIISTFIEKLKKYLVSEELSSLLSYNDFDLSKIQNKKTAIFIITGINDYGNSIVPLFIDETIHAIDNNDNHNKRLNIILDDFETLDSIKDYTKLLSYSRGLKIRFTNLVKNLKGINNIYGKENGELLKLSFSNMIYLFSSDLDTVSEVSYLCGNIESKNKTKPLITPEELKVMDTFTAVILKQRMMPFKTKLLPDYKMDWNMSNTNYIIPKRDIKDIKIYKY